MAERQRLRFGDDEEGIARRGPGELLKGTRLLEPGTRRNIVDPETDFQSIDHLMRILNINLQARQEDRKKKKSRRDRMKGLFGSR